MTDWITLLDDTRFADLLGRQKVTIDVQAPSFSAGQFRFPAERDHDRILFSTPLRRMGDKTQVFPLESIESIRTRLTHSYEVANLARSVGVELVSSLQDKLPEDSARVVPAMLAAVGLAHDIGNPPFGHQGENAIRDWFKRNEVELFQPKAGKTAQNDDISALTIQHKNDFLNFEGNAQTLRILTKLQVIGDDLGLNITCGTLAAIMKYTASSDRIDLSKKIQARKKVGYFASEADLVAKVREKVGLEGDARHPLALVMEACDDIAYSILDAEDSIKKGLVSFNDLVAWLQNNSDNSISNDPVVKYVCDYITEEIPHLSTQNLHPGELNDITTQKFRVLAIHVMITAITTAFKERYDEIVSGSFNGELIKSSQAAKLCSALKDFDRENAFSHQSVLEVELNGFNTLNRLMDFLWMGISQRESYKDLGSKRTSPFAAYVYSRISRNYRRVFEGQIKQCPSAEFLEPKAA